MFPQLTSALFESPYVFRKQTRVSSCPPLPVGDQLPPQPCMSTEPGSSCSMENSVPVGDQQVLQETDLQPPLDDRQRVRPVAVPQTTQPPQPMPCALSHKISGNVSLASSPPTIGGPQAAHPLTFANQHTPQTPFMTNTQASIKKRKIVPAHFCPFCREMNDRHQRGVQQLRCGRRVFESPVEPWNFTRGYNLPAFAGTWHQGEVGPERCEYYVAWQSIGDGQEGLTPQQRDVYATAGAIKRITMLRQYSEAAKLHASISESNTLKSNVQQLSMSRTADQQKYLQAQLSAAPVMLSYYVMVVVNAISDRVVDWHRQRKVKWATDLKELVNNAVNGTSYGTNTARINCFPCKCKEVCWKRSAYLCKWLAKLDSPDSYKCDEPFHMFRLAGNAARHCTADVAAMYPDPTSFFEQLIKECPQFLVATLRLLKALTSDWSRWVGIKNPLKYIELITDLCSVDPALQLSMRREDDGKPINFS